MDERGIIQAVDIHTGEVRTVETSLADPSKSLDMTKFKKVLNQQGELVYVPVGITMADLEAITGARRAFPYSPILADRIVEDIANGDTLVDISKKPGMPTYAEIARWRRDHPEFDEAYKLARKDRGEIYFSKILDEVAKASADKDEVALARLRTDIWKFAAKVSSPEEFTEKQSIDARVAVGTFSIETGIRRPGDPGFNADETAKIRDSDPSPEFINEEQDFT